MSRIGFCFLFALAFFEGRSQSTPQDEVVYREVSYGICRADEAKKKKSSKSPTGSITLSENFAITEKTDHIAATIGQQFAIEFVLDSKKNRDVTLEQVWIFPQEITDHKGKKFREVRYKIKKPTNQITFSYYTLEQDYEIVKGKWVYQMYLEGKLLCEKIFILE